MSREFRLYIVLCALGTVLLFARIVFVATTAPDSFLPLFDTKVELTGQVVGDPDVRETSQRITVEVEHEGEEMRILVVTGLYPAFAHGESVTVSGKLERPEPFATDGGRVFRYDHFLAKDGIFGIIQFAKVESRGEPASLALLYAAKHAFIRGFEAALPEPYAALAGGLIAGGKQGLGSELLDAFTDTGLIHIVVLSGYNVMIVAEAVLKAFGFLRKRTATMLAMVTIALFVLAAGAGAASIRAGLMALIALIARATGRTYDALRALALVFFLMLLHNPLIFIYDPGFQFSFVATLGLILGAPIIESRLGWIRQTFLRDIVVTTLAAQLFVLPLLLYQTGNLSLIALPANVIALPLVPAAMLFSAVAGVVGMLVPAIAPIIGIPALALLWYLVEVAKVGAALPLASVVVPAFPFWLVPVMYLLLGCALYLLKRSIPTAKAVGMRRIPVEAL